MNGFLLDTNVISEFARPDNQPNPLVKAWLETTESNAIYASVLTFGEIRKGIERLQPSNRRSQLEAWLKRDLREWFANRLLIINAEIAERWGALDAAARQKGIGLPIIDGLLCATALEHGLTLVSRNVSDFAHSGVTVLDPWHT